MDDYTEEERAKIAAAVEAARLDRRWGKEEAARHAKISSITWKRVEDGQRVQSTKMRSIEIALGWAFGSIDRIARDRPVVATDPDTIEEIRARGFGEHSDKAIWEGFRAATQFAQDCQVRGAPERLANDFIGDAVALLNAAAVGTKYPELGRLAEQQRLDTVLSDTTIAFGVANPDAPDGEGVPVAARRGQSEGQRRRREQDEAGEPGQDDHGDEPA